MAEEGYQILNLNNLLGAIKLIDSAMSNTMAVPSVRDPRSSTHVSGANSTCRKT